MVQFCYLRQYLGFENGFSRLLQRMARMDMDWTFWSFKAMLSKITIKVIMASAPWWNLFDIYLITPEGPK